MQAKARKNPSVQCLLDSDEWEWGRLSRGAETPIPRPESGYRFPLHRLKEGTGFLSISVSRSSHQVFSVQSHLMLTTPPWSTAPLVSIDAGAAAHSRQVSLPRAMQPGQSKPGFQQARGPSISIYAMCTPQERPGAPGFWIPGNRHQKVGGSTGQEAQVPHKQAVTGGEQLSVPRVSLEPETWANAFQLRLSSLPPQPHFQRQISVAI